MRSATTHNFIFAEVSLLICTCTILYSALLHHTHAAKSEGDEITLSIEEQCPNFTRIDELSQRPQLIRRLQAQSIQPSTCTYSWIQKKHPLTSKLFLDERTGAIYTIDTIDREEYLACSSAAFCCNPATIICSITVSVGVQCGSQSMMILHVILEITDKNDHVPRFPTDNFTIEISESAEVGSKFYFPAAVDPDSNPYSLNNYELIPRGFSRTTARDLFEIKPAASSRVQLSLKRKLDREVHERYDFEVRGIDRQSKYGSMNLTVLVSDVNDHSPVFTAPNKLYNVTVPEDFHVGGTVIQVHATDNDTGENAAVSYEFHETASPYVREKFTLDEDTGSVTLRSELDYESMNRIEFFVVAKNRATNPIRFDEASVSISVQNVNDEPPQIEVEYRNELVNDKMSGETSENLPNTFVAFIFVSDRDAFGGVNCTLSNDRFRLESIFRQSSSTDFRLNATRPFDREMNPVESVTITCADRGQPPRSSSQLIKIHVKDANDQSPTFLDSPIRCSLTENNHVGAPICQISQFVRDLDEGENSLVKYTLEKSAQAFFRIEEYSGFLSAVTTFDRENRSSYQFLVFATDQGKPPLSATGTVVVSISDVNDNAPRFSSSLPNHFYISEQTLRNEYVGTVRAVDPDDEINSRIVYALDSTRTYPFRITESGEIFTTHELDRETQDSYQILVYATDSGNPPQTSSAAVTIDVTDVNDCRPTVTFPSGDNNTVRISYMEAPGRQVTAVDAYDRDAADTKLTFSIVSGNGLGLFSIDSSTGSIFIAKSLVDALGEHFLQIRVQDNGSPVSLRTEVNLRMIVDNSAPSYEYQQSHFPEPTQVNAGNNVNIMHVLIIAALACGIVFILLAVSAIIIRRRLIRNRTIFASSSSARKCGKQRKAPRKFPVLVDRLLPSNDSDPATKTAAFSNSENRSNEPAFDQDNNNQLKRDYKVGTTRSNRCAQRDVTNQEDLEVQAVFSKLDSDNAENPINLNNEEMIYSAVDTVNGMYDDETYAKQPESSLGAEQGMQTLSEHVCPHGRPGTFFPFSMPAVNSTLVDKLKPAALGGLDTPVSDQPVFRTDLGLTKNITARFDDKDTRSCGHQSFNSLSFNQVPTSVTSTIPMRNFFQEPPGHFCVYPPRPHTAMHALQANSFNSVAVSIAAQDPALHCNPPACVWAPPGCLSQKAGYFQYDECNNVTPVQPTTLGMPEKRCKRDKKDKYCSADRANPSHIEIDAQQNARVYGIVKGSFV